jgi:hypothetical protein
MRLQGILVGMVGRVKGIKGRNPNAGDEQSRQAASGYDREGGYLSIVANLLQPEPSNGSQHPPIARQLRVVAEPGLLARTPFPRDFPLPAASAKKRPRRSISPRNSGGSGVPLPRPSHPRPLPKQPELPQTGELTASTKVL